MVVSALPSVRSFSQSHRTTSQVPETTFQVQIPSDRQLEESPLWGPNISQRLTVTQAPVLTLQMTHRPNSKLPRSASVELKGEISGKSKPRTRRQDQETIQSSPHLSARLKELQRWEPSTSLKLTKTQALVNMIQDRCKI